MTDVTRSNCPACGEPVKPEWKICPLCETRLQSPVCPVCGLAVEARWKRCPECEALLVCPQCRERMPKGETHCPRCQAAETILADHPDKFIDPVCGLELVRIPGGVFQMGDNFGNGIENERPVHKVRLDDYYIGRYPVTQSQWLRLMSQNPSRFSGADLPVEQVTWADAQLFARKLTEMHQGKYIFHIPTEAQWEYAACSGGRRELYAGGDDINALAWYEKNSQGETHPVGGKKPNGLDLYDMSGNVLEWCQDSFAADAYEHHSAENPLIELPVPDHVIRGGSWGLDAWSARCSRRLSFAADFFGAGLGFRLVMVSNGSATRDG